MAGIAFKTADKLAISLGLPTVSPERVDEALMYAIAEGETEGHQRKFTSWLIVANAPYTAG